jgi:hypothetical protein
MELSRRSFTLSTTAVAGATLAGQSADDRPQAYRKEAAEDGWKRDSPRPRKTHGSRRVTPPLFLSLPSLLWCVSE